MAIFIAILIEVTNLRIDGKNKNQKQKKDKI